MTGIETDAFIVGAGPAAFERLNLRSSFEARGIGYIDPVSAENRQSPIGQVGTYCRIPELSKRRA